MSTVLSAYADPATRQETEVGGGNLSPARSWRGGRAVECGGLENRFGLLGPTRVQIPPPPLNRAETSIGRTFPTKRESLARGSSPTALNR
jgi:hypothetical protein